MSTGNIQNPAFVSSSDISTDTAYSSLPKAHSKCCGLTCFSFYYIHRLICSCARRQSHDLIRMTELEED